MRTLLPYLGAGDTVSNMLDNFEELNTKHIPLGKARADQAFALMTANNRIISRWNSVTETYSTMLRSLMYMPEVDSQLTALDQRLVALEAQLAASSKQQADSGASVLAQLTGRLEQMEGRLRLYALM